MIDPAYSVSADALNAVFNLVTALLVFWTGRSLKQLKRDLTEALDDVREDLGE